ncbi:MAG: RNA methyltransferase [Dermatophilaceae bacterium]
MTTQRREGTVVTNPRNERVRSVAALARRSVRSRRGQFVAEGPQSVEEAVRHRPDVVSHLYVEQDEAGRQGEIAALARAAGIPVSHIDARVLAAMSDAHAPQGPVAVCRHLDVSLADVLAAAPRLLCVLAHVRDPGNAGTVLRGADACGVDAVIVTDGSVDVYNPKVVRSTAGSLFHVPLVLGVAIQPLLEQLRGSGLATYATDSAGATRLDEADLTTAHAWVFGNEAWGLPEDTRRSCDKVIRIPIRGRAESLNLAMAATLCLFGSSSAQHTAGSTLDR